VSEDPANHTYSVGGKEMLIQQIRGETQTMTIANAR
jgi:hypothetical protein